MTDKIISRKEAIQQGLKFYFTGKPCKSGHTSERYTSNGRCRECHIKFYYKNNKYILNREKKYREKNKEKISQSWKNWYKKNAIKHKNKNKTYAQNNINYVREYALNYYNSNKEKIKNNSLKWAKENKEKVSVNSSKRRARKRNAEGFFTKENVLKLGENQKWKCVYCYINIKNIYHVDHIIPLIKGGSNFPKNLQLLCPTCNLKKSAKHPIDFAQENGLLL